MLIAVLVIFSAMIAIGAGFLVGLKRLIDDESPRSLPRTWRQVVRSDLSAVAESAKPVAPRTFDTRPKLHS